jgi:hypothetical protein
VRRGINSQMVCVMFRRYQRTVRLGIVLVGVFDVQQDISCLEVNACCFHRDAECPTESAA